MTTDVVSSLSLWQIAGWTMLHFLWVGTLIGIFTLLLRMALRSAPIAGRYCTMLLAFALLTASPIVIAAWMATANPPHAAQVSLSLTPRFAGGPPYNVGPLPSPDLIDESTAVLPSTPEAPRVPESLGTNAGTHAKPPREPAAKVRIIDPEVINSVAARLPWLWLVGSPLTFAWLAAGLIGAERLRRGARTLQEGPILEAGQRMRSTLHMSRQVAIAISDRIAAPILVGIVRPIILLPPAALTGWTPDEIEMVLLHELAHVRRWDNFVNLLQRVTEALLFFHPAVWLLSNWIRRDREACCDAIVVAQTNRPQKYAETLVTMAASSSAGLRRPVTASAYSRHPLASRIRSILRIEEQPMRVSRTSLALVVLALLAVAALAMISLPQNGQADDAHEVASASEVEETALEPLPERSDDSNEEDAPARNLDWFGNPIGPDSKFDWWGNPIDDHAAQQLTTEAARNFGYEPPPDKRIATILRHPLREDQIAQEIQTLNRAGFNVTIQAIEGATMLLVDRKPRNSPFPTLEEQKLADQAWNMLGLELERIDDEQLQRVKDLGYTGGLKVVNLSPPMLQASGGSHNTVWAGDIVVGLHVWPTTTLTDVGSVLARPDLGELAPLKFYVVRLKPPGEQSGGGFRRGVSHDTVVTGRIDVKLSIPPRPATAVTSAARPVVCVLAHLHAHSFSVTWVCVPHCHAISMKTFTNWHGT